MIIYNYLLLLRLILGSIVLRYMIFTEADRSFYYIMILFKQFYWLSCCHLTFHKIWYCLIKTHIDLVSLSFNVIKQLVFFIGQYKFLWTLWINIHLSLKASVNIVFKVHINSYSHIRTSGYLIIHWDEVSRNPLDFTPRYRSG